MALGAAVLPGSCPGGLKLIGFNDYRGQNYFSIHKLDEFHDPPYSKPRFLQNLVLSELLIVNHGSTGAPYPLLAYWYISLSR